MADDRREKPPRRSAGDAVWDESDDMTVDDLVRFAFGRFVDGDLDTLERLAGAAASTFGDVADDLARVPEPLRGDESRARAWAEFAIALARMLAANGDTRLAERLFASPDNPIGAWHDTLEKAQRLRADGRFAESYEAVRVLLDELRASSGPAVDELLGKAVGTAAANAFELGRLDDALRLNDEALRACEKVGDVEGVGIYSANLATVAALLAEDGPHGGLRRHLARAQRLHDDGRLDEAFVEAAGVLGELESDGAAELLAAYGAKAHGLFGMIHYRQGDLAAARAHTAAALDLGTRHSDQTAIVIYTANLEAIGRAEQG